MENGMNNSPSGTLLNKSQVAAKTGLSASTIYRLCQAGKFPKPVRLSERRVAWKKEDVEKWFEDLNYA
ncbi:MULTISPECIES: helix-turn-helix transcriptional regulator [Agarivorans]|uniref:helix-turn-helix transcriptional regulator n=1 Tax=Agarivorans TaxID=261825 RepID=UPI001C7DEEE1|nr:MULTISPECIES: AlpA family phage regulatory protein [Agarivorans]